MDYVLCDGVTCHLDDILPDENPFRFKLCVGALHGSDTIYPSVEITLERKLVDSGTSYCMYYYYYYYFSFCISYT